MSEISMNKKTCCEEFYSDGFSWAYIVVRKFQKAILDKPLSKEMEDIRKDAAVFGSISEKTSVEPKHFFSKKSPYKDFSLRCLVLR